MRKMYFAYGANTNMEGMMFRCPSARPEGRAVLQGHKLIFRHVADVVLCKDSEVPGALWSITDECERSLDRFEGFPRPYVKKQVTVVLKGRLKDTKVKAMVYVMNTGRAEESPSLGYFQTILEGYGDFGWEEKAEFLFKSAYGAERWDKYE